MNGRDYWTPDLFMATSLLPRQLDEEFTPSQLADLLEGLSNGE